MVDFVCSYLKKEGGSGEEVNHVLCHFVFLHLVCICLLRCNNGGNVVINNMVLFVEQKEKKMMSMMIMDHPMSAIIANLL